MNPSEVNTSTGYLVIKASTARGAIPLEGASVNIRGGEAEQSGILFSLRTDRDGKTEPVALPTPDPALSASPNRGTPYASYHVDVFKEGYIPLFFHNVPVFPGIISVQPAVMIPSAEGEGAPA